jgi:hypothetical protein
MSRSRRVIGGWRSYDPVVLIGLAIFYAATAILIPPYFPLLQPDSASYLEFSSTRTALYPFFLKSLRDFGLDLVQITYVQVGLFSLSLLFLLSALLRTGVPRPLIVLFVALLCVNVYFSSFHRTILAESLFCAVMVGMIAFLLDFLRSGKVIFLALAALGMGLLVGLRPAAVGLVPALLVPVWVKWRSRNATRLVFVGAIAFPFAFGILCEWLAYRVQHGDSRDSIASNLWLGRAAMLARPGITFTGPQAEVLMELSQRFSRMHRPVEAFLSHVPLPALPIFTAGYALGQEQVMRQEIERASQASGEAKEPLIAELAKQTIIANITGQIRLTLLQYVGQWSIASLTFPPTARAINMLVDGYPDVPIFHNNSDDMLLHPQPRRSSYLVYPAFLTAGVVTLLLTFVFIPFLLCSALAERPRLRAVFLAAFFSLTCQLYTLILSFVNFATPRYLMAIYPVICLAAVFILMSLAQTVRSPGLLRARAN